MIRVLHVITDLNRGGAETVLYKLVTNNRTRKEQRHIVISLRGHGVFGRKMEAAGITVYTLHMDNPIYCVSAFVRLILLVRSTQPDIVQTWLYHADILGGLASKLGGGPPVIWSIHTAHLDIRASLVTRTIRKLCALLSRYLPSKIVCVANSSAEIHKGLGYDAERMIVIPNGFELPDIAMLKRHSDSLRVSLNIDDREKVIGCVGRFHPDKDYPTFLSAAVQITKKNCDVRFLMVGKGLSNSNEVLNGWIMENGLSGYVLALGERSDIYACLMTMDVFCLSSSTEAFPLVLGEAMSVSRPVVTTDVGDASILVGGTGIIVPKKDPKALADGILSLLQLSDNERNEMGSLARARIRKYFRIDSTIEKICSVYNELVDELNREKG